MKTYRDCIQALLDGETLKDPNGYTVWVDEEGDMQVRNRCGYICSNIAFVSPADWSIKKPMVKKWQWVFRNTITGETGLTEPSESPPRLLGTLCIVCRIDSTVIEEEAGEEEYVPE